MSKVLESVMRLKQDMYGNWRNELDRINILQDVNCIYKKNWPEKKANTVLAFIVLAYDLHSGYIEMHKDRYENKKKILDSLDASLGDKDFQDLLENNLEEGRILRIWLMNYIKDWRWESIMACYDFHSESMRFGSSKTNSEILASEEKDEAGSLKKSYEYLSEADIAEINKKKGENIKKGIEQRKQGEELHNEIRREYVKTDTSLEKEGYGRMTEAIDVVSWEKFIQALQ